MAKRVKTKHKDQVISRTTLQPSAASFAFLMALVIVGLRHKSRQSVSLRDKLISVWVANCPTHWLNKRKDALRFAAVVVLVQSGYSAAIIQRLLDWDRLRWLRFCRGSGFVILKQAEKAKAEGRDIDQYELTTKGKEYLAAVLRCMEEHFNSLPLPDQPKSYSFLGKNGRFGLEFNARNL